MVPLSRLCSAAIDDAAFGLLCSCALGGLSAHVAGLFNSHQAVSTGEDIEALLDGTWRGARYFKIAEVLRCSITTAKSDFQI